MSKYSVYAILAILLTAQSAFAQQREFKIGYITDLSGKAAFMGTQSRDGALLAEQELQRSGKKIRVIFGDHKTDAKTALSEATKLISLDKIDALLCDTTPACVPTSNLAKEAKIPFMYQSPVISIVKSNPYAFRNFLDYEKGCESIARHWKSLGFKNIGHLKLNLEFGELCLSGSRKIFPEQTVIDYNSGDDLKTAVTTLKSKGVEAIFQTAYEIDMLNRLQACSDLKYFPAAGGPEVLITKLVSAKTGDSLKGTVVFGFPEIKQDFVTRLLLLNPKNSLNNVDSAAIAYMHVKELSAVLSECGSGNIDCQIRGLSNQAADETMDFKGWQDRVAQYDFSLKTWADGKLVPLG